MQPLTLSQACHFDWGGAHLGIQNFAVAMVERVLPSLKGKEIQCALDLGCTVGRSSFELARYVDEVVGVEADVHFVRQAQRLKESGSMRYTYATEGVLTAEEEVHLNKFGLAHASKKVNFWQGSPEALKPIFQGYDLIVAKEILTQVKQPKQFLEDLLTRLHVGGVLVLTSVYDWCESVTPKEAWLGGFVYEGKEVESLEGLERVLEPSCRLLQTEDVTMLIPQNRRQFDYGVSQMSIWQRI